MKISSKTKPMIMGLLMGFMMVWMAHGALTGDGAMEATALIAFAAAHVVLIVVVLAGAVFAARLSPRAKGWIDRLHRPSLSHVGLMLVGAVIAFGSVHLVVHGMGGV